MSQKLTLWALALIIAVHTSAVAQVNWRQCEGTGIRFLMTEHPFSAHIRQALPEFEQLTGIQVKFDVYPLEEFRQRRTTALQQGTQADGFMIMPGLVKYAFWKVGWLQPLEAFIDDFTLTEEDWDIDDFFAAPMESASIDSHQIGIPFSVETSLLAYRKDLFTQFGISVPETLDSLEAAAQFFHKKEVEEQKLIGLTMRGNGAEATSQWSDFLYSFGGSWLDEQGNSNLATPESIAALAFYAELLRNYRSKKTCRILLERKYAVFAQGKAAMIINANVFFSLYEHPQESRVAGKIGYAPIPAGPAGRVPHVSDWSLAISAISPPERQKAAWLFVQWATRKEHLLPVLLAGVPVARESVWISPEFQAQDRYAEWTAASLTSLRLGQSNWSPPVVNVSAIREIVGHVLLDALHGKNVERSAEEAAKKMNDKMIR